jgi:diguanylate cyclase (GGDEF)-like protein
MSSGQEGHLPITLSDFASSARAVIDFLHRRIGFDLWLVTRKEGNDHIVLQSEDHGYDIGPGHVFSWSESLCKEMVDGRAPRIAPRTEDVPAYAAKVHDEMRIKAYIGAPIYQANGALFGTICAIDPSSQPGSIVGEGGLIDLLAAMLSLILQAELGADQMTRQADRLRQQSRTDPMTNLYNRLAWDELLATEELRCRTYGHPAAVFVIDLDGLKHTNDSLGHAAGDALIARAAAAMKSVTRSEDIVARLGGDEFGIVCRERNKLNAESFAVRLRAAFAEKNVQASIGFAMRQPMVGIDAAVHEADMLMLTEKSTKPKLAPR